MTFRDRGFDAENSHSLTSIRLFRPTARKEKAGRLPGLPVTSRCQRPSDSSNLVLRQRPFLGAEQVRVSLLPRGHTTLHVVPLSIPVLCRSATLSLHPLFVFCWCNGVDLVSVAAQKSCKRRIHVTSSTSSTTATQLPATGATFSSPTGTLSNSDKLRSLYTRTSPRTRPVSYSALSNTSPKESSQGSLSETSAFTDGTSEELARHLNKTFGRTFVFPPELATRLLTHASHPASRVVGHNARFAFIGECYRPFHHPLQPSLCLDDWSSDLLNLRSNLGRRIIESYFLMFLHSCPNVNSGADYAKTSSNALNTYTLGEHVGREWGIGKVLKWKSMVDSQMIEKGADNGHVGLHKVLGTTVEAIVGGVYHQFVCLPFPIIRPPRFDVVLNRFFSALSRELRKPTSSSIPISFLTSY